MPNIIVVRHFDDIPNGGPKNSKPLEEVVQVVQEIVGSLSLSRSYLGVFTRTGISPGPTARLLSKEISASTTIRYQTPNNRENILIDRMPNDWDSLQGDLVDFCRAFPHALVCIAGLKWIAGLSNIGMKIDGFTPNLSLTEMEEIIPPGFVTTFKLSN